MKPWKKEFWDEELPRLGLKEAHTSDIGFRKYQNNQGFICYSTNDLRRGRTPHIKACIDGITLEFYSPSAMDIEAIVLTLVDSSNFMLLSNVLNAEPWFNHFTHNECPQPQSLMDMANSLIL